MSSAYDIVMENRRELVRKVIDMMKQGYFFNTPEWDRAMLCPQNPLSKVRYEGKDHCIIYSFICGRQRFG